LRDILSPVSIQTQSLALRKRKTQALALASSQSWLPLLRPSIPIGWRLRLLRENPTQALAFLAVFVYATHAIAFEWKPGFRLGTFDFEGHLVRYSGTFSNVT